MPNSANKSNKQLSGLGHLFRRTIHLLNLIWPWLYYSNGQAFASLLHISSQQLLWWAVVILLATEAIRLSGGWQIFGQRSYEKTTVSAFTWGGISTLLVLLYAPGQGYALAIISSYALVDPLMGELRRRNISTYWVVLAGILTVSLIWLLGSLFYNLAWWLTPVMAIITVAAEWPSFRWVDDNAMLQLIPLLVVKLLNV